MLLLNRCVHFVFVFLCFKVIPTTLSPPEATTPTTTTTSATTTTNQRYGNIPQTEELTLSENRERNTIPNDPLMKLTQLMAVQLEGKSESVKPILRNIIHDEVEEIIKGLGHDNHIRLKQSTSLGTDSNSCGKDTLLLLDNIAKEVRSLTASLEYLKSDIALWKSNSSFNLESKLHSYEHATKSLSTKTPIGVNYYPKSEVDEKNTAYKKIFPRDCEEVQELGNNKSGVYKIQPRTSTEPFLVLCDMETRGGGWIVIQKRFDGSQDFYLDYRNYKFGFGDLDGEFWIGLEHIYSLVGLEVNELLVEIVDRDNKTAYAHYKAFGISSEADGYALNVLKGFSGDAGDSLVQHFGSKFSTKDFDQDENDGHCAQMFEGGWWYKSCHVSNLNGKFMNVAVMPKNYKFHGMHWLTYRSHEYCHAKSRMMVRPARLS